MALGLGLASSLEYGCVTEELVVKRMEHFDMQKKGRCRRQLSIAHLDIQKSDNQFLDAGSRGR